MLPVSRGVPQPPLAFGFPNVTPISSMGSFSTFSCFEKLKIYFCTFLGLFRVWFGVSPAERPSSWPGSARGRLNSCLYGERTLHFASWRMGFQAPIYALGASSLRLRAPGGSDIIVVFVVVFGGLGASNAPPYKTPCRWCAPGGFKQKPSKSKQKHAKAS